LGFSHFWNKFYSAATGEKRQNQAATGVENPWNLFAPRSELLRGPHQPQIPMSDVTVRMIKHEAVPDCGSAKL